ncbi:conserved hypothetical protein [Vibrio chagasii]|nr:conserved hypothetical protein [Vibrio chagasii]CAH6926553.1 conserved hypothetical protein [Vibrio chagasii]CAH7028063.1 conserved hypothetical protein [Vibrio chagasii]CAH7070000.1 conserved hypothetical protein [Vibrio chagasii]CAH7141398.1 conserved hypothetical protein [Vibrio chagasii]
MFQLVIGVILGVFLGFVIFMSLLMSELSIDATLITNVVIALATVVAATIHFNSVRLQRRDRVWEINKDNLLDLSETLSQLIKLSESRIDYEFYLHLGVDKEALPPVKPDIGEYERFTKALETSINVYKPMLSDAFVEKLDKYRSETYVIDARWDSGEIENEFSLYSYEYDNQITLQASLSDYIKTLANVENT